MYISKLGRSLIRQYWGLFYGWFFWISPYPVEMMYYRLLLYYGIFVERFIIPFLYFLPSRGKISRKPQLATKISNVRDSALPKQVFYRSYYMEIPWFRYGFNTIP